MEKLFVQKRLRVEYKGTEKERKMFNLIMGFMIFTNKKIQKMQQLDEINNYDEFT